MSRIGRQPITVPSGVELTIEPDLVRVKGPKGELQERVSRDMKITQEEDQILVARPSDRRDHRALHGLTRSLVANMVQGVTDGFEKKLEIQGVGYRAAVQGKVLNLQLGFSHDVPYAIPAGITITTEKPTMISVSGIDKQLVGQVAAEIRSWRPPEPYKGKGVRYEGEYVRRKEGKKK